MINCPLSLWDFASSVGSGQFGEPDGLLMRNGQFVAWLHAGASNVGAWLRNASVFEAICIKNNWNWTNKHGAQPNPLVANRIVPKWRSNLPTKIYIQIWDIDSTFAPATFCRRCPEVPPKPLRIIPGETELSGRIYKVRRVIDGFLWIARLPYGGFVK